MLITVSVKCHFLWPKKEQTTLAQQFPNIFARINALKSDILEETYFHIVDTAATPKTIAITKKIEKHPHLQLLYNKDKRMLILKLVRCYIGSHIDKLTLFIIWKNIVHACKCTDRCHFSSHLHSKTRIER